MPESVSLPNLAPPPTCLDRHAQRRDASIPTISVLSGPVGLAVRTWHQWAASRRLAVVQLFDPHAEDVATLWTATVASQRDLTRDALGFLAAHGGRSVEQLEANLAAKTVHDLERLWDHVLLDPKQNAAAALCHWITRKRVLGETLRGQHLAQDLEKVLAASESPWQRVIVALSNLLPPAALPSVLLAQPRISSESSRWMEATARFLSGLALQAPRLAVALAIEPATLERYLQTAPEAHSLALVREGVVRIPALDRTRVVKRFGEMGLDDLGATGAAERLALDGASEDLVPLQVLIFW